MGNIGEVFLQRMSVDDLKPADYNPREMSDKAREGLSNSINTFGLLQPIIWNKRTGNVVGGHQRLYDIINKGATETDVVVVDLPLIKEKALNISLNNSAIAGEYTDGLQDLLDEIDNGLKERLMLDTLEIPDWESLPELGDEQDTPIIVEKIIIAVKDSSLVDEIRDEIARVLDDHYTPSQVEIK